MRPVLAFVLLPSIAFAGCYCSHSRGPEGDAGHDASRLHDAAPAADAGAGCFRVTPAEDVDDLQRRVHSTACARDVRCPRSYPWIDETHCAWGRSDLALPWPFRWDLFALARRGVLVINPDADVDACLDEIAQGCAWGDAFRSARAYDIVSVPSACERVLVLRCPAPGTCWTGGDCSPDDWCDRAPGPLFGDLCGPGTCRPRVGIGAECTTGVECARGAVGAMCAEGRCATLELVELGEGEPCGPQGGRLVTCAAGLLCTWNARGVGEPPLCIRAPGPEEPCARWSGSPSICAPGTICTIDGCAPVESLEILPEGDACGANATCDWRDDLSCDEGACARHDRSEGSPCDMFTGRCDEGLVCHWQAPRSHKTLGPLVCRRPGEAGAWCAMSTGCESGCCVDSVCQ